MRNLSLIRWLPILLLGGWLGSATMAAETVYRWVDENGVVHYSQQPPATGGAEAISVRDSAPSTPQEQPAELTEEQRQAAQQAEFCRVATQNYESLSAEGEVKSTDEYGEVHVLTPGEKVKERERAKAAMERYCAAAKPAAP